MKTGGKHLFEDNLVFARMFPDGSIVVQGKRQKKSSGVTKEHVKSYLAHGISGLTGYIRTLNTKLSFREAYEIACGMRGER